MTGYRIPQQDFKEKKPRRAFCIQEKYKDSAYVLTGSLMVMDVPSPSALS